MKNVVVFSKDYSKVFSLIEDYRSLIDEHCVPNNYEIPLGSSLFYEANNYSLYFNEGRILLATKTGLFNIEKCLPTFLVEIIKYIHCDSIELDKIMKPLIIGGELFGNYCDIDTTDYDVDVKWCIYQNDEKIKVHIDNDRRYLGNKNLLVLKKFYHNRNNYIKNFEF
jgi:hypothetical protein